MEVLNDMETLHQDPDKHKITAQSAILAINETAKTMERLYASTTVARTHLKLKDKKDNKDNNPT